MRGYSTLIASATTLGTNRAWAHAEGRLAEQMLHFTKPKLLVAAEIRYQPSDAQAVRQFSQLVSRRHQRGSILVTSNRSVAEWDGVIGDAVVATAILDRLLHHRHVITIRGDSYGLQTKRASAIQSD